MQDRLVSKLLNTHGEIAERIVPGLVGFETYFEHIERYRLIQKYANHNRSVVDLASGSGYGSYYLACQNFSQVTGIDRDVASVAYAQATYCSRAKNLTYEVGDAANIPVPGNQTDIFVSFETVEHIPDPASFLQEIERVLKPGGVMLLSTPNKHFSLQHGADNPYHISEMFLGDLLSLVKEANLEVAAVYGQGRALTEDGLRQQPLQARLKRLLPQSLISYVRNYYLIPKRNGIPAKVVKYYYSDPVKFEDWITENDIYTPCKPELLDLNNLQRVVEQYQTFIIDAKKVGGQQNLDLIGK
jgi:SAM-dependent methyltransferase